MSARLQWQLTAAGVVLLAALTGASLSAQRGGGGGGRGGGGVPGVETRSRLTIIAEAFELDKDQKKAVKDMLDAAYKDAAPIRAALKKTRTALGAAVIGAKSNAEIDAAAKDYAVQVSAMTGAEMKALAKVLTSLNADQRAKGTMTSFYLMRGAFLDDKKWDEIPDIREY